MNAERTVLVVTAIGGTVSGWINSYFAGLKEIETVKTIAEACARSVGGMP